METIVINKTMQEIFDNTVEHFAKQAQPSAVFDSRALSPEYGSICKYHYQRGDKTLKCAIGVHIPPEKYNREMEGKGVGGLLRDGWLRFPKAKLHFLLELQQAHDCAKNIDELLDRLFYVAKSFNLNYDKLSLITKWEMGA